MSEKGLPAPDFQGGKNRKGTLAQKIQLAKLGRENRKMKKKMKPNKEERGGKKVCVRMTHTSTSC